MEEMENPQISQQGTTWIHATFDEILPLPNLDYFSIYWKYYTPPPNSNIFACIKMYFL